MTDFMKECLTLAQAAARLGEVPIACVITYKNEIISTSINEKELNQDCTDHAEMLAIRKASKILGNWRLIDCHMYSTLEPCIMCAGAIMHARIAELTYGAKDPKFGAMGSLYDVHEDQRLNHSLIVHPQVYEQECSELLKKFFRKRRKG